MWDVCIDTNQCGQEAHPGEACIEFHSSADLEQFLFVRSAITSPSLRCGTKATALHVPVRLLVYFPTKDIRSLINTFKEATQAAREDA